MKNLILNLSGNNLGGNIVNIKYLGESIKQLPEKLEHLELCLSND